MPRFGSLVFCNSQESLTLWNRLTQTLLLLELPRQLYCILAGKIWFNGKLWFAASCDLEEMHNVLMKFSIEYFTKEQSLEGYWAWRRKSKGQMNYMNYMLFELSTATCQWSYIKIPNTIGNFKNTFYMNVLIINIWQIKNCRKIYRLYSKVKSNHPPRKVSLNHSNKYLK